MKYPKIFLLVLMAILILIVGLLIYGFYNNERNIGSDIGIFVDHFNFPKPQRVKILLEIPEKNTYVFEISYGDPQDCIAGCFFYKATGIKHNNKIGWIPMSGKHDDYDYDIDSNDDYLFTDEFYNKLISTYGWKEHIDFLALLARDSDTPDKTLLKIINKLSSGGSSYLANVLLENPKIQSNKQMLVMIIGLPQLYSVDEYSKTKDKARILLYELK